MVITVGSTPCFAQSLSSLNDRVSSLYFGELGYREREDQNNDGFTIGQGVAQFTIALDDRLTVFSEMTATARKSQNFEFEIERLFVRYDFSDQFKLSAGRFHTPLGYWNAGYHHGSWLQTTVSRPETMKFGSNIVPIHFVGALLEGNISNSDFGYKVGYGNGRSEKINSPGDLGDSNNDRAWLLAGNYRPPGRHRVNTGISMYVDKVSPDFEPDIDEQLYTAYFALEGEQPEIIVEYVYSNHESSLSKGQVNSFYGQVAYRLSGDYYNFKPYLRAERLDVDDADPLLGSLGLDYKGVTVGTKWDYSPSVAFKAEVRREEFNNSGSLNSFWLQLTFVFGGSNNSPLYAASAPQIAGGRR